MRMSRRLHRLLAFAVALPAVAWGASGTFLAAKRLAAGRLAAPAPRPPSPTPPFEISLEEAAELGRQRGGEIVGLRRRRLAGRPLWEVETRAGELLLDGRTGAPVARVDVEEARGVALEGAPVGVTITEVALQTRFDLYYADFFGELPVHRIRRSDAVDVYVSPRTGQVLARSPPLYRANRFFFAWLHTWDLVPGLRPLGDMLLALGGLLLVASGVSGALLLWRVAAGR